MILMSYDLEFKNCTFNLNEKKFGYKKCQQ